MTAQEIKVSLGRRIRNYFVAGLLAISPIALTIYIVWHLFIAIDGLLKDYVSLAIFRGFHIEAHYRTIPGLGILALLLVIFLVGFLTRNFLGRKVIVLSERLMSRIPVVRPIYSTLNQISHAFLSDKSEMFKRAALIEYPRKGIYSIGFITQDTKGVVQDSLPVDTVSVFLPTTPNPTSGFLLFVPKKNVRLLDISVEEALKLVISGGAIIPGKIQYNLHDYSFGIENKSFNLPSE